MIEFDHVTKRFGNRLILEEISLQISPGDFITLVGPTGSGKSTLIKLLLAEEKPTFGHLSVNGTDLSRAHRRALQDYRKEVGVVFQDCKLLERRTVYENIAFALEARNYPLPEIIELTNAAITLLNLHHIQDHFPHQISGGEAQRVALARAVVYKPKLLLADEPTGHLDAASSEEVLKQLVKINMRGTTVVLATHEAPDLPGQRVVRLVDGKIAE